MNMSRNFFGAAIVARRRRSRFYYGVWALLELTDALEIRSETGNENYAKSTSITFQALGTMVVCSPRITRKEGNDNNKLE